EEDLVADDGDDQTPGLQPELDRIAQPFLVEAPLDLLLRPLQDGALLTGAGRLGLGVGQRRLGGLSRRHRFGAVPAGVEDAAAALQRAGPTGEGTGRRRTAEPAGDTLLQAPELGQ